MRSPLSGDEEISFSPPLFIPSQYAEVPMDLAKARNRGLKGRSDCFLLRSGSNTRICDQGVWSPYPVTKYEIRLTLCRKQEVKQLLRLTYAI
jgi:hypothetical protein